MNTKELEKCLYLIDYWSNSDETVIAKALDNDTDFIRDYIEPYSEELNKNLLSKNTIEAKTDLIKYYIFEFFELQGFFKVNESTLSSRNNKDNIETLKTIGEVKTDFEKYVIVCLQYFDIIFNELQLCCIKYNIDFFKICNELNFSSKYFDSGITFAFKEMIIENIPLQQTEKSKPELNEALISFKSTEIIESLHNELKGYFQGKEAELKKVLQGEQVNEFLLFPHHQNKFVEVFKRLKYNGFLLSTPKETKDWICSTFTYQYQKGNKKEVREFNTSTVHDILTKNKGEPTKKERICIVDWLPYKGPLTRQKEAEKESI
jgi:hypothetical protein